MASLVHLNVQEKQPIPASVKYAGHYLCYKGSICHLHDLSSIAKLKEGLSIPLILVAEETNAVGE